MKKESAMSPRKWKSPTRAGSKGQARSGTYQKGSSRYSQRRLNWQAPLYADDRGNVGLDQGGLFEVARGRPD